MYEFGTCSFQIHQCREALGEQRCETLRPLSPNAQMWAQQVVNLGSLVAMVASRIEPPQVLGLVESRIVGNKVIQKHEVVFI